MYLAATGVAGSGLGGLFEQVIEQFKVGVTIEAWTICNGSYASCGSRILFS